MRINTVKWYLLFLLIYCMMLVSNLLFPITYDDFAYSVMVFLFVALVMSVKLFWELYPDSKMIPLAIKSVILTAFIIFGIQCFAWNRYRKEYNHVMELINKAKAAQKPEVKVPAFTRFAIKTPLGIFILFICSVRLFSIPEWPNIIKALLLRQ